MRAVPHPPPPKAVFQDPILLPSTAASSRLVPPPLSPPHQPSRARALGHSACRRPRGATARPAGEQPDRRVARGERLESRRSPSAARLSSRSASHSRREAREARVDWAIGPSSDLGAW